MKKSVIWSLRLGFSSSQAKKIESLGIDKFLANSFKVNTDTGLPNCLEVLLKN